MFELADRLVGIYKPNNCTKSVTINPGLIAQAARPLISEASQATSETSATAAATQKKLSASSHSGATQSHTETTVSAE